MAQNIFPVFDVPTINIGTEERQRYNHSAFFDFDEGDFKRDGAHRVVTSDGKDTYIQWCRKIVETERFTCLSYGTDIGTEMYDALDREDHLAVESAIERTITEALKVNAKTDYVRNFEFTWNGDNLECSFTVKGKEYDEEKIKTTILT
jgi:hypothetical protein